MSVLALDAGTTGVTALVVSASAEILARGYSEFPQHFPDDGWVEHDPNEIWGAALTAVRAALDALGPDADRPTAVGITNQRETVVLWDRETLGAPRRDDPRLEPHEPHQDRGRRGGHQGQPRGPGR